MTLHLGLVVTDQTVLTDRIFSLETINMTPTERRHKPNSAKMRKRSLKS